MACRTGCPTKDHESWGACARAASIQIDKHGLKVGIDKNRVHDNRLNRYASLRRAGLQPRTTSLADVQRCEEDGGVPKTEVIKAA